MKILLFTKKMNEYQPFINKCTELSTEIKIVYSSNHPRKKEHNFSSFVESCKEFKPDILISFYYNKIIQNDIIRLSNLAVNFHGSLLPNYAGAHTINWQIINGEKTTGVTIHELTKTIDGGRIILQDKFKIGSEDTSLKVLKNGIICSVKLLDKFINDYKLKKLNMTCQIKNGNEFVCKKRKPEDGELNKKMSHVECYNMIRALASPWPGAFYYDKNNNKVILKEYLTLKQVKQIL